MIATMSRKTVFLTGCVCAGVYLLALAATVVAAMSIDGVVGNLQTESRAIVVAGVVGVVAGHVMTLLLMAGAVRLALRFGPSDAAQPSFRDVVAALGVGHIGMAVYQTSVAIRMVLQRINCDEITACVQGALAIGRGPTATGIAALVGAALVVAVMRRCSTMRTPLLIVITVVPAAAVWFGLEYLSRLVP
jgi:hypothetical protein